MAIPQKIDIGLYSFINITNLGEVESEKWREILEPFMDKEFINRDLEEFEKEDNERMKKELMEAIEGEDDWIGNDFDLGMIEELRELINRR